MKGIRLVRYTKRHKYYDAIGYRMTGAPRCRRCPWEEDWDKITGDIAKGIKERIK